MPRFGVLYPVLCALAVTSCVHTGVMPASVPNNVPNGSPAGGATASVTPPVAPAESPMLHGSAVLGARPLTGATVVVRRAADGRIVSTPATTDGAGQFSVRLDRSLSLGTPLVIAVTQGETQLLTTALAADPSAMRLQQVTGPEIRPCDLATTLVVRMLLAKLVEVGRSSLSSPAGQARLRRFMGELDALFTTVAASLATTSDSRVAGARDRALDTPNTERIQTLATLFASFSGERTAIAVTVRSANGTVLANVAEGQMPIVPGTWQLGDLRVPGPQLIPLTGTTARLVYGDVTIDVTFQGPDVTAGSGLTGALQEGTDAQTNTLGVFGGTLPDTASPTTSGRGGGGGAPAPTPTATPTILSGTVRS